MFVCQGVCTYPENAKKSKQLIEKDLRAVEIKTLLGK